MQNSFDTLSELELNGESYHYYSIQRLGDSIDVTALPFAQKILLENLLRHEDGTDITKQDIELVANWKPKQVPTHEISFTPARVLLQDFTGVPAVVDLAAMRDAVRDLGGDPRQINPLSPVELVIDHSVQVDRFGSSDALEYNSQREFERNKERYEFLKWGQSAFKDFSVVPPATGIVHQVNLEYLARVVFNGDQDGKRLLYPDTLVGTDSHTTMINGLGILGWGVGGIEAEAAMLGQPISMLVPQTVGFELSGKLPEAATATDLVLTVVKMLREYGVVGKFVEFFGNGLDNLPVADRATIANMAPEYGATCGLFPIDEETLCYLRLSGRKEQQIALIEKYAKLQGMFRHSGQQSAVYSGTLKLDMTEVVPCLAGPKRPQDKIPLTETKQNFIRARNEMNQGRESEVSLDRFDNEGGGMAVGNERFGHVKSISVVMNDSEFELRDGAVVIAAITSCTNTSNPAVMLCAGLLARNATALGLDVKPWVKTSLAPGSKVVTSYLDNAGVLGDLEHLGFHVVGYGCTTCIGNSGPLPKEIQQAVSNNNLVVASVLSGNRNFEGRIHSSVKTNYLASPPLVVAYALAGRMDIDLYQQPLGTSTDGNDIFLKDIWPSGEEIQACIKQHIDPALFNENYANLYEGSDQWKAIKTVSSDRYEWSEESTYIKNPPYFVGMSTDVPSATDVKGARCLVKVGDSVTTDHISPAGAIAPDSPAGRYLLDQGVDVASFNSYGSRRGNHEVMVRGTFANVRLRNQLAPETEGGWTTYLPTNTVMSIYQAAMLYQTDDTPLIVLGGKEYGTGSSRDWAAKGTVLLGVKAVLAESFERIHRSNLIGMGVVPLTYMNDESAKSLGLIGNESFSILGLRDIESNVSGRLEMTVVASSDEREDIQFSALARLDTPKEIEYYQHGGILQYVLRKIVASESNSSD
ncbi:MAG: aconitate hydratase [Cryomorphaceae bacterium]|jgi:aconitate hydratase